MVEDKLEISVNDDNFTDEVIKADLPVLVDFWAEWCFPCRMSAPLVGEMAAEYKGRIKVCKANVDSSPKIATEYGIMSVPTFIIFKDGKEVDRLVGVLPKTALVSKLNSVL